MSDRKSIQSLAEGVKGTGDSAVTKVDDHNVSSLLDLREEISSLVTKYQERLDNLKTQETELLEKAKTKFKVSNLEDLRRLGDSKRQEFNSVLQNLNNTFSNLYNTYMSWPDEVKSNYREIADLYSKFNSIVQNIQSR